MVESRRDADPRLVAFAAFLMFVRHPSAHTTAAIFPDDLDGCILYAAMLAVLLLRPQ